MKIFLSIRHSPRPAFPTLKKILRFNFRFVPRSRRKMIFFSLIFLITLISLLTLAKRLRPVSAAWFDDAWAYRKAKPVATHTSAENKGVSLNGNSDEVSISDFNY